MIKRISLGLLACILLASVSSYFFYSSYRSERLGLLESNSQIANTPVGPIEYQLIGNTGPVLLLIHGTPGGYDQVIPLGGFRVLSPSRPGYLRTPIEVGESPLEQAHAYAALLDTLSFDSVIVMGISGGGPSAISFVSTYPDRAKAFIAVAAMSAKWPFIEAPLPPPTFIQRVLQSDYATWAGLAFMGLEGKVKMLIPNPSNQQKILSDSEISSSFDAMTSTIWPMSRRYAGIENDYWQSGNLDLPVAKISIPTLIIHGTEDTNVPFVQSENLADNISGSILHVVEGGDHFMPWTHADEVDLSIQKFLNANNIL